MNVETFQGFYLLNVESMFSTLGVIGEGLSQLYAIRNYISDKLCSFCFFAFSRSMDLNFHDCFARTADQEKFI